MREPYNATRVINLHCGLGRDSAAMVCLAAEHRLSVEGLGDDVSLADIDAVVFSDTGREWPHTYEAAHAVAAVVREHGGYFFVVGKSSSHHYRPDILADFRSRATVASLGKGDCTDNHKIQPLRRYMSEQHQRRFGVSNAARSRQVRRGDAVPSLVLIGIAADETSRLAGEKARRRLYVDERYPLATMGIAKRDEAPILSRHGLDWIRKSGCYMCPYQPVSWYWALAESEPDRFAEVVAYEQRALNRNPRMNVTGHREGGRNGRPLRLPELVDRWRQANPDATVDAVLTKQYSRCNADARAMRRTEATDLRRLPVVGANDA